MSWTKLSKKKPRKNQLCDFLFQTDFEITEVWILCRALPHEGENFGSDDETFWRPSERLPRSIVVDRPKLPIYERPQPIKFGKEND